MYTIYCQLVLVVQGTTLPSSWMDRWVHKCLASPHGCCLNSTVSFKTLFVAVHGSLDGSNSNSAISPISIRKRFFFFFYQNLIDSINNWALRPGNNHKLAALKSPRRRKHRLQVTTRPNHSKGDKLKLQKQRFYQNRRELSDDRTGRETLVHR